MLNRREAILAALGAATGLEFSILPKPAWAKGDGDVVDYPLGLAGPVGWRNQFGDIWGLRWTGWKSSQSSLYLVGQWFGIPRLGTGELDQKRHLMHVGCPGGYGTFARGDIFNLTVRPPQRWIDMQTSQEDRDKESERALVAILNLLNVDRWLIADHNRAVCTDIRNTSAWSRLRQDTRDYMSWESTVCS